MTTLLFALLLACQPKPVTLAELSDDPERAGARLMRTPMGLNRLDDPAGADSLALVAVHGFESEGSEWVEPLRVFGEQDLALYFYHWKDRQCPDAGAAELRVALTSLLRESPQIERLVVVAHSYGGVISALAVQAGTLGESTELEMVASPLAGHPSLLERCGFSGVPATAPADGVQWRQWRTQHEQDGAFRDLPTDPQDVELPNLIVTELPATWQDGRLGHNRSLQYVAITLPLD